MSRLVLATLLTLPLCAVAAPRPEGLIESDTGRLEVLGQPVRVGETIELPEGYIRVEEAGTEDDEVGSFTVVSAQDFLGSAPAPKDAADASAATGPAGADAGGTGSGHDGAETSPLGRDAVPARVCRAEKTAYLRELWKMSGIEVKDPEAVLDGLEAGSRGPSAGFYWFALATDPFRPLAWNSDLRSRADALARCVKEHGT